MKIYTKTGDDGETGLFAGARVRKDDLRIEAIGAVDELNAVLGLARCEALPMQVAALVAKVQNELFAVGAELATPDPKKMGTALIQESHVAELERAIDQLESGLAPLMQFILPGGNRAAAMLHVARGVCRSAERRVVTLLDQGGMQADSFIVKYLNRLSDYLFVAARAANHEGGVADVPWNKPK